MDESNDYLNFKVAIFQKHHEVCVISGNMWTLVEVEGT